MEAPNQFDVLRSLFKPEPPNPRQRRPGKPPPAQPTVIVHIGRITINNGRPPRRPKQPKQPAGDKETSSEPSKMVSKKLIGCFCAASSIRPIFQNQVRDFASVTVTAQTLRRPAGLASIGLATLFLCAAGDIPANRRALDEARTFLIDCTLQVAPDRAKECKPSQDLFLFDYLRAMSGETLSMKNLAFYFSPGKFPFVSFSIVRSCEWALAAQFSGRVPEDGSTLDGLVDRYCHDMSNNDFAAAKTYATRALATIARSPTRIPRGADGDAWPGEDCDKFDLKFAARGQFAPPRCRLHTGKLDSTVTPLQAEH